MACAEVNWVKSDGVEAVLAQAASQVGALRALASVLARWRNRRRGWCDGWLIKALLIVNGMETSGYRRVPACDEAVSLTVALEYVHLFGEQGQSLRR